MRRIAGNLLWMLTDRGLQIGVGIGVVAMLARGLGPEGFAHFQYAQSVVLIASAFALVCGAEVVVPRLVANTSPVDQHRILAQAFVLRLGGGVLGYVLMCVYLSLTSTIPDIWHAALWLGVAILLREPFGVVTAWMQAHTNYRPGTLISLAGLAIKATLIGVLFGIGSRDVSHYAAVFALEPVVLAALLLTFYLGRTSERHVAWRAAERRELITAGALFWVSFILMMAARRVDQLVLQPSVSATTFGAYAACMQILDNFTMLATILVAGIAPIHVYARASFAEAHRNIGRIALGVGVLGLAGALAIAVLAPWIVLLLYGDAFAGTVTLLRIAAVAASLIFVDVSLTLLAVYLRKPGWVAIKWAAVLACTLAFDLAVVPQFGTSGAIGGYALGNGVAVTIGLVFWWRHRPVQKIAVA